MPEHNPCTAGAVAALALGQAVSGARPPAACLGRGVGPEGKAAHHGSGGSRLCRTSPSCSSTMH
eukprot:1161339-Pelagomonas_calceolata.AAC.6